MSNLKSRLVKKNTIKNSDFLHTSVLFSEKDKISTSIPILNIALSGEVDGGFYPGLVSIAGPSRHFKSALALEMVASYLRKYEDAIVLFYDSEFGSPASYFESFGVNAEQVIHKPIKNIEEMRHDLTVMLSEIERNERVIVLIDSIGNLASKKESDDAKSGKEAEDMTRARKLKSFYRIITPHLVEKNIPVVAIQHVYNTMEMFSKTVMSGGCLTENHEVVMFDGKHKYIQDIQVGDLVKTLDGPKLVTHTWNPDTLEEGEPECYEIIFDDNSSILCSDKHRIMDEDKNWKYVTELKEGDEVLVVG